MKKIQQQEDWILKLEELVIKDCESNCFTENKKAICHFNKIIKLVQSLQYKAYKEGQVNILKKNEYERGKKEATFKKLEWGKTSAEEMNWQEAMDWCKEQGEGWRLPTRVELAEAFDNKVEGFGSDYYWSSTTAASNTSYAWYVHFYNGYVNSIDKTDSYYVRCVRQI